MLTVGPLLERASVGNPHYDIAHYDIRNMTARTMTLPSSRRR